jgi:hypothetical protein
MKKRSRPKLTSAPEHPEADRRHIVRRVVRYGLRDRQADQVIADVRKSLRLRNKRK